jgi:hypothetical protein
VELALDWLTQTALEATALHTFFDTHAITQWYYKQTKSGITLRSGTPRTTADIRIEASSDRPVKGIRDPCCHVVWKAAGGILLADRLPLHLCIFQFDHLLRFDHHTFWKFSLQLRDLPGPPRPGRFGKGFFYAPWIEGKKAALQVLPNKLFLPTKRSQ